MKTQNSLINWHRCYSIAPSIKSLILIWLLLAFYSCQSPTTEINPAEIKLTDIPSSAFNDLFTETGEAVQLESGEDLMLGGELQFKFYKQDIYVLNAYTSRVVRFGNDGRFLNFIGEIGRGPNENISVSDFTLENDEAILLTCIGKDSKVSRYDTNGEIKGHELYNDFVAFGCEAKDDTILLYTGYNKSIHPNRLYVYKGNQEIGKHLPKNYTGEPVPIVDNYFLKTAEGIFIKEPFQPFIYQFVHNELKPIYHFDFGEFSIPKTYWETPDPFKAFESLKKNGFANIRYFLTSPMYSLIMVVIEYPDGKSEIVYITHHKATNNWNKAVTNSSDDALSFRIPVQLVDDKVVFVGFNEEVDSASNPSLKTYSIRQH